MKPRVLRSHLALPVILGTVFASGVAHAAAQPHGPDLPPVLAALVLILLGAKLGGVLVARLGQPAVLGELVVGVVLGNLGLLGFHGLESIRDLAAIDLLAQIGVLFLLFDAGLESDVAKMVAVGWSSLLVAVIGVIAPIALGFVCSAWFYPGHNPLSHWFVGATLCATSVGITARVLADLRRTGSTEGRIILGAAVVDDVLGLIVLAVVAGVIKAANAGQAFHASTVLWIIFKAAVFLAGAILIGRWLSVRVFKLAARLTGEGLLLTGALGFCFGLAYLASLLGLAPIVGAFAAGLILDEVHYQDLRERDHAKRAVPELLEPITTFFVPVFFVLMGMRVDLSVFGALGVLGFAAAVTVAAVAAKQACALGVLEKGADRIAVGLGMIPRGEVGLIFAGIGSTLTIAGERVVDDATFSAVVTMVALTTLVTPPLLAWRLRRTSAS
jgi:Kef-type K+ transport system membrane component KefB